MRTSLDLCFCLLTLCGITSELCGVKVVVKEDSDAVLPCLISTKVDLTGKLFFWKKDGQKEVFFYDSGIHYNNDLTGQDEQFKGRVSHFQDQLKNGNASIKIQNTKMADSGNYSCIFPLLQLRQTFNIELVVEPFLKDRSGETTGASKPCITILDETKDWSLLQCEVRGASPEPKVEWQDSSGNILPAEEPQVSESGGRYYVTINTTVTKTGRYRCVVTQEELYHQSYSETFVQLNEDQPREVKHWRMANILVAVLPLVVAVVCWRCRCCRQRANHLCNQIIKSCCCLLPKRAVDDPDTDSTLKSPLNDDDDSDNDSTAPPPYDMEQDNDCRASENRADFELTERPPPPYDMEQDNERRASENRADTEPTERPPPPHDMEQDNDCRASENRADSELTQSIARVPGDESEP